MRDDRDFTSYVTARWTQLVRCLFAAGAPLAAAHRGAAETLSRCHDEWAARDEWVDLDVHVFRDLLDRWDRRRDAWWERPTPASDTEAVVEAGWPEVEAALDRMSVPDRRALVLREAAGLSPEQVLEVTGGEGGAPDPGRAPDLFGVLELVPVDAPPIDAMIAVSERRRRRRRAGSIAGGVALVAVAGLVTALVLRQPDPDVERNEFPPVRSLPFPNPVPAAWYAAGTLYLPRTLLELRDVREFAQLGDGAVYLDLRGNLVSVTGDGERELITTLGADSTFAVSDADRKLIWVDSDGPELVVHDLATGAAVVRRPLDEQARVIAVDGGRAYLAADGRELAVDLDDGRVEATPSEGLLDVADGVRAVQDGETAFVVRRAGAAELRLEGTEAQLDPRGRRALAWVGGGPGEGELRLYDTERGRRIDPAWVDPTSVAAAGFGPEGSVIIVNEPPGSRIVEVRVCQDLERVCPLITFYPAGAARAVLPR